MLTMVVITNSSKETQELAPKIIRKVLNFPFKKAKVVALEGELGAGKTTLVQAIARELGVEDLVKSPTFVLLKNYKVKNHKLKVKSLFHIDCYRLRDEKDLEPLGAEQIFSDPDNIVLIEWSDRVRNILPKLHITIHIDHIGGNKRRIGIR